MKKIVFSAGLFAACIVLLMSVSSVPPSQGELSGSGPGITVMSLNIRYNNPGDGENAWPHRKDLVAAALLFHKADIAGFQEALFGQIKDLEGFLSGYDWVGVGRSDGKTQGEFSPIFYRKERFELLEHGTFWLSESPETAGSKSWDAALPRIVTWAKLTDRLTQKRFFFFNTHFDHRGEKARAESAKLLLEQVRMIAKSSPVIVTGDFNSTPEESPYRILVTGETGLPGLRDCRSLVKRPYGGTQTFNGFKNELQAERRIDYVFINDSLQILRFGIMSGRWDARFVSDHNPVLAEVRIF